MGLDLPFDDRVDPGTARADLIALCLTATQTQPVDPGRRETFEFRVGDEVASLADGVAHAGPIDDPDVVVEGGAEGLYYMFIDRRLDGVTITGDRALLEQLIDVAPELIGA